MAPEICVMCGETINELTRSFEQLLIDDKDFCRSCWDEIINTRPEEVSLPVLSLVN